MAWRGSQLLLAPALGSDVTVCCPGVRGWTVDSEELRRVVGQSLYVQCQYQPEAGPYVPKSWCHQISSDRCNRVVTTSQPRRAITDSQHTIWDDPEVGFFNITVTQLTEKDSANYWCGLFNSSRNAIRVLRNISLVVSPAVPTLPPLTSFGLQTRIATTIFVSFLVLTASPEETTGSFTNGSQHRR
ncbi:Trem-like transcript 4 protein [Lemmus lemmus]